MKKYNGKFRNIFGIVLDKSFNTFKALVEHLERIINKKFTKKNTNLSKLYSIAYIKIYLKYFVTLIKDKTMDIKDASLINNFICSFEQIIIILSEKF